MTTVPNLILKLCIPSKKGLQGLEEPPQLKTIPQLNKPGQVSKGCFSVSPIISDLK